MEKESKSKSFLASAGNMVTRKRGRSSQLLVPVAIETKGKADKSVRGGKRRSTQYAAAVEVRQKITVKALKQSSARNHAEQPWPNNLSRSRKTRRWKGRDYAGTGVDGVERRSKKGAGQNGDSEDKVDVAEALLTRSLSGMKLNLWFGAKFAVKLKRCTYDIRKRGVESAARLPFIKFCLWSVIGL